jgi:hypothetical protein
MATLSGAVAPSAIDGFCTAPATREAVAAPDADRNRRRETGTSHLAIGIDSYR